MSAMTTNTAISSTLTRSHKLQNCFPRKELLQAAQEYLSYVYSVETPGDFESSELGYTKYWPA